MDRTDLYRVLAESEFFRDLDTASMERIAGLCRVASYGAGDYVFRQGDLGDRIYVIAEGQVFLERALDLGPRSGRATIGMLGKGRVLGCWSTLLGEPHNLMSSAVCQKPTTVLTIKGSSLRDMMVQNTALGFRMLEKLCFLLRDRIQGAYGAMEKL